MFAFIEECIKANKEIYEHINFNLKPEDFSYHGKIGAGGDKSLQMDLRCESIFVKYLSSFGNIYSEEAGFIETSNTNHKNIKITIDPLDGSENFLSSFPYYGTAVAYEDESGVKIGIVCNLINGLVYTKNEEKLQITYDLNANIVDDKVLQCGETKFGIFERSYFFPEISLKLRDNKLKFRSPGAVALSFACAKYYSFVLFYGNIREFDIKAALYICNDLYIYQTKEILLVSKNKEIFCKLKNLLNNNRL